MSERFLGRFIAGAFFAVVAAVSWDVILTHAGRAAKLRGGVSWSSRCVAPKATAGEVQDDKQQS